MLRVSEVFYSIQGEGSFAGTPAAFIRLQGCPVGCSFCDTKQTWRSRSSERVSRDHILQDRERPHTSWANIEASELVNWVEGVSHRSAIVVITGGEPLAQAETVTLVQLLREAGRQVQIETSGTFDSGVFDLLDDSLDNNPWITVSPKFEGKLPVKMHLLEKANEIKVVLSSPLIEGWIRYTLNSNPAIRRKFYIQPETGPNFAHSAGGAVALCKEFGCRLSLQSHTFLKIR